MKILNPHFRGASSRRILQKLHSRRIGSSVQGGGSPLARRIRIRSFAYPIQEWGCVHYLLHCALRLTALRRIGAFNNWSRLQPTKPGICGRYLLRPACVSRVVARARKRQQRMRLAMNNNEPIKRRRRINVHEFAAKLLCHPDTIKRRIKKPPPQRRRWR